MTSSSLTAKELRWYRRQIMLPEIGEEGQQKLKDARVLVLGVGETGIQVLQYLGAGGIGYIGMVDHEIITEDVLKSHILFGTKDLGKLKTVVARDRLSALNPDVLFNIINLKINPENIMNILGNYSLIIDTSDNYSTRYLINDACVIAGKPWIFGETDTWEGKISVFNYQEGPTLRCLYPEFPKEGGNLPGKEPGLTGILPGLTGCLLASEAFKIIAGFGKPLSGELLVINTKENTFRTHNIIPVKENLSLSGLSHHD